MTTRVGKMVFETCGIIVCNTTNCLLQQHKKLTNIMKNNMQHPKNNLMKHLKCTLVQYQRFMYCRNTTNSTMKHLQISRATSRIIYSQNPLQSLDRVLIKHATSTIDCGNISYKLLQHKTLLECRSFTGVMMIDCIRAYKNSMQQHKHPQHECMTASSFTSSTLNTYSERKIATRTKEWTRPFTFCDCDT